MAIKIYEQFAPFANPADGDYPLGSFKNDSIPGAEDGTPLDAVWANDYAGFDAELFAQAGIVPNGSADKLGASQRMDAVKKVSSLQAAILLIEQWGYTYKGTFAKGFTYSQVGDVGVDADFNAWIYVGAGAPNKVVSAGTVPSEPLYQVIHVSSLQALSGLTEPSDLSQRVPYSTTVAEIATGVFKVGDMLRIRSRDDATFDVLTEGSYIVNGFDILNAGAGKVAVLHGIGYVTPEFLGVDPNDSGAAIQAAVSNALPAILRGNYYTKEPITQTAGDIVMFEGGTVSVGSDFVGGSCWIVDMPTDTVGVTRTVLASPSLICTDESINIKGIVSPWFAFGLITNVKLRGFTGGGIEIIDGVEATVSNVSASIHSWSDPSAVGFFNGAGDSHITDIVTISYPVGVVDKASSCHYTRCHPWGLPANVSNQYARRIMLIGFKLNGANTSWVQCHADSPDTKLYTDVASEDNGGIGWLCGGFEQNFVSCAVQLHPQSAPNKMKAYKFNQISNTSMIGCNTFGKPAFGEILEFVDPSKFYDNITITGGTIGDQCIKEYTNILPKAFGAIGIAGNSTMTVVKSPTKLSINYYCRITNAGSGGSGNIMIPLPDGITESGLTSSLGQVGAFSAITPGSVGMTNVYCQVSGGNIIIYLTTSSGGPFASTYPEFKVGYLSLSVEINRTA